MMQRVTTVRGFMYFTGGLFQQRFLLLNFVPIFVPVVEIRVGEMFDGRYLITQSLGRGVFSNVARANDTKDLQGGEVAIKIIRNNDLM